MRYIIPTILTLLVVFQPQNANANPCTITKYSASAIKAAQASCSTITIKGIQVTAGQTLDLSNLKNGAKVIFAGRITWGYKEWEGPLIKVAGTGVTITGASGHVLDGRGKLWWDGIGGNGGKKKPMLFRAILKNSKITGLNIKDSPVFVFSIYGCEKLTIDGVKIDNSAGDSGGGHNTDGFDIGNSNGVTINKCTVHNQDDCLAINSGRNIVFSNNVCIGGHGISIAVGGNSQNVVKDVKVSNCKVINSMNGIRIKTVYGTTGSVSDITYSDITLSNISQYGIAIQGDYTNARPTGTPTGGVPVTGVTVKNVKGTVASGGTNYYFLVKNAANWKFSNIKISGSKKKNTCSGIPSGSGISC